MGLANEIERLRGIEVDRDDKYVGRFENVLASIANLNDPDSIVALAEFFDDDAEFDELMFSIIHTIEIHDDETYCRELLKAAPGLCSRSPRWASIVFMRILNSDSTRTQLVLQLRNAPAPTKDVMRNLMERINERSVEFTAKTTPIIINAPLNCWFRGFGVLVLSAG